MAVLPMVSLCFVPWFLGIFSIGANIEPTQWIVKSIDHLIHRLLYLLKYAKVSPEIKRENSSKCTLADRPNTPCGQ